MKQKQYILYRYKINFVFIWVDFIKQGKIPCLFFSRDRTFSPPENGASSACLKASCLRSQPQAASAGPALSNVPDGTRHFPQQADKTDAFYNRHWKPNGSPVRGAQMSMRERSQGKGGMPGSLRAGADAHLMKIGETRQASPRGNANIKSPPSSCATKEKDGPALLLFPFPSRHAKSPYSKRTVRR